MSGWEMAGDGGVFTTVEDLARSDENFTSHTVGGPALTELMSTRANFATACPCRTASDCSSISISDSVASGTTGSGRDIEWIVTAADGRVAIVDVRGDRTPVSPIFRDAFAGPGTVRFERDHRGKVTALIMTTTGVYALRFPRVSPKPRHVPQ